MYFDESQRFPSILTRQGLDGTFQVMSEPVDHPNETAFRRSCLTVARLGPRNELELDPDDRDYGFSEKNHLILNDP